MSMVAMLLGVSMAQTKTFSSQELDLSFQHPTSWKVNQGKKGDTKIEFPIAGGGTATLEIFAVQFREPGERWQEYQLMANQNLKRTVDRQWQEEILGAPLLMTRIFYSVKGEPVATLVGLMYRAWPKKFNFRLTAPSAVFDEAERELRSALLSLRTLSGAMPDVENPDRIVIPTPEPPKPDKPKKVTVLTATDPGPSRVFRGRVQVPTKAAGKDVILLLPDGWSAEPDGQAFSLTRKGLVGSIRVEVAGILDSPPPDRALMSAAGRTLTEFAQVLVRDEPPRSTSKAGAKLQRIRREGRATEGPLVVLQAVGATGDYYWLLEYRAGDAKDYRKDARALDNLLQGTSVVLAQ